MQWTPLPPQDIFLVLISVRGRVNPRATGPLEGLNRWKIQTTPSEIESTAFWLIVPWLNQLRQRVPQIEGIYKCKTCTNIHLHIQWTLESRTQSVPRGGSTFELNGMSCTMLCNAALMVRLSNFYSSFKPNFSQIFCSNFKLFENQSIRLLRIHCIYTSQKMKEFYKSMWCHMIILTEKNMKHENVKWFCYVTC
jgi:hypothetical protein